jgi:hypothetical protein
LYSFCAVAVITTYVVQIGEANYYTGMQPWEMNTPGFGVLVVGLILIIMISMQTRGLPSEFFLVFYSSIVVLSFVSLNPSSGTVDWLRLLFSFQLILVPLIVVWIAGQLKFKIRFNGLLSSRVVEGIVFVIVLLVAALAALHPPSSASMDIVSTLDRRLEGRDLYGAGSLMSYALSMTMNGLTPYLGYKAGVLNRKWLLLAALAFEVFFFWLIGVKAPLLYVFLAYFMGVLVAKKKHTNFSVYFLYAIVLLFGINLLEWLFFDYSLISDFFFRRLFAVQAQIQGYYLDFIMESGTPSWNYLTGSAGSAFTPTFYIGEFYFGNVDANANTNAFLYAFSLYGVFGYIFAMLFITIALTGFDALYRSSKNPVYLYLGFIYGLLLVEQAFSTAMVSSGVGLLFLLALLEKNEISAGSPPGDGPGHAREVLP